MPKKKKTPIEDLVVPPQDNRICGVICICQMTLVLSTVAVVYLSVAIYMPSMRAFNSGISSTPIMCTTIRKVTTDNCTWGSCGEWCLSKTSGSCDQIFVALRNNGSDLYFTNCTKAAIKDCLGLDPQSATKFKCKLDQCKNFTGTYNCTQEGECMNITEYFKCEYKHADPPIKCSGRRGKLTCMTMKGLYNCSKAICERIRSPYNCGRKCQDIPTRNKNVIVLSQDSSYLSSCQRGFDKKSGQEIWNENQDNVLMLSCYGFDENLADGTVHVTDCINGTLADKNLFTDFSNSTYLNYVSVTNNVLLDKTGKIAPMEMDLQISNESKLMINMEGCVNTLKEECKEFLRVYGKDGTDHNARARFPCFYSENKTDIVVKRFNLDTTYKEFIFSFIIPITLFVISCLVLVLCQKTVEVGDDAKMRIVIKTKNGKTVITRENSKREDNVEHAMDL